MQPGNGDEQADSGQVRSQFFKRDVLARVPKGQNIRSEFLNPPESQVASLRPRGEVARLAPLRMPTNGRRRATPNRIAAVWQLNPSSTAARSRERKSIERG